MVRLMIIRTSGTNLIPQMPFILDYVVTITTSIKCRHPVSKSFSLNLLKKVLISLLFFSLCFLSPSLKILFTANLPLYFLPLVITYSSSSPLPFSFVQILWFS